jgi:hypothetical protein
MRPLELHDLWLASNNEGEIGGEDWWALAFVMHRIAPELILLWIEAEAAVKSAGTKNWPVNCDALRMALDMLGKK